MNETVEYIELSKDTTENQHTRFVKAWNFFDANPQMIEQGEDINRILIRIEDKYFIDQINKAFTTQIIANFNLVDNTILDSQVYKDLLELAAFNVRAERDTGNFVIRTRMINYNPQTNTVEINFYIKIKDENTLQVA